MAEPTPRLRPRRARGAHGRRFVERGDARGRGTAGADQRARPRRRRSRGWRRACRSRLSRSAQSRRRDARGRLLLARDRRSGWWSAPRPPARSQPSRRSNERSAPTTEPRSTCRRAASSSSSRASRRATCWPAAARSTCIPASSGPATARKPSSPRPRSCSARWIPLRPFGSSSGLRSSLCRLLAHRRHGGRSRGDGTGSQTNVARERRELFRRRMRAPFRGRAPIAGVAIQLLKMLNVA